MGDTADSVTLMGSAHRQISVERELRLKTVLKEHIKTLCGKETSDSKYLFEGNLLDIMKKAKESFRISNILLNNSLPNVRELVTSQSVSIFMDTQIFGTSDSFSASHSSKLPGPQKESPASRIVIQ